MELSASDQDGLTGSGLTLPPENNNKNEQNNETMLFKILEIRQQRIMIPEKRETNEVIPYK